MEKVYLDKNWELKGDNIGKVAATVPGCVHTDLINCGQIKDLYWRDNNKQYKWIENCDFSYSCLFDAKESCKAELVFEGLDTYSDIYLNGEKIGSTDDMFIEYRFNIGSKLKLRDNLLEVKFRSPVKEVENEPKSIGAFTTERMRTRRIQCTYGWDWVDRFVTCGIYRPVYIEYGDDMCVDSAYILTESIDEYSAQLYLEVELKNYALGGLLQIEILSPKGEAVYSHKLYSKEPKIVRRVDIESPHLWYPLGYGEHPLYTLRVKINDNVFCETFGIRTVKVLQLPDKEGSEYFIRSEKLQAAEHIKDHDKNKKYSGFQVIVNSKKIMCCGANWVPCEPFPSAEADEKIENILSLAEQMNVNMIRVWGGGIFEKKYFYDLCDKKGILVTQDFLMACGVYPEKEEWFLEKLRTEAEYAVKHFRNHPCLAWWSGDNENAVAGNDRQTDFDGRNAALSAIAPIIYANDRGRAFFTSSPYGGDVYASSTVGTTHNTVHLGPMCEHFSASDGYDYKEFLGQFTARFIAEEPTYGAISRRSSLRFLTEEDLLDENESMLKFHTKGNPVESTWLFDSISSFALKTLGAAIDSNDRDFKYRYIQYEWVRVVFENYRRNLGFCNGLIFWMLNDCWPAFMGWSFIDYYCMPKASLYAFKRCAAKCVVSVINNNDGYSAVVSNAYENTAALKGKAYLLKKSNNMQISETYEFSISVEGYSALAEELPWKYDEDYVVICDIDSEDIHDRSFYKDGKLEIRDCTESIKISEQTQNSITLIASEYVHAVELEGDCLFSDNYFSLLPGEEITVTFEILNDSYGPITATAYTLEKTEIS